jgi:hypothetical protein
MNKEYLTLVSRIREELSEIEQIIYQCSVEDRHLNPSLLALARGR